MGQWDEWGSRAKTGLGMNGVRGTIGGNGMNGGHGMIGDNRMNGAGGQMGTVG